MFGYTAEELQNMTIQDIHPKESLPYVLSDFETQARGDKTLAGDIPCLRKDGTIFYSNINTTNVIIDQRPSNVGLFTDITERRHAEEAIRETKSTVSAPPPQVYRTYVRPVRLPREPN